MKEMNEILTDELLDMIGDDYQEYKNRAIHVVGLDIMTFDEYLKLTLSKRKVKLLTATV